MKDSRELQMDQSMMENTKKASAAEEELLLGPMELNSKETLKTAYLNQKRRGQKTRLSSSPSWTP